MPDTLDFLEQLGVSVCNLDYPTTWNSFDMQSRCIGIGRNGYFRMHSRNVEKWFSKAGRDETYIESSIAFLTISTAGDWGIFS